MSVKIRAVVTAITFALAGAPLVHASPEDPYGNDYVAVAINPLTGQASYGASGTEAGAVQIAMAICSAHGPCVVGETMHHGCVVVAFDPTTKVWVGGRGPDMDAAITDVVARFPVPVTDQLKGGAHCSS